MPTSELARFESRPHAVGKVVALHAVASADLVGRRFAIEGRRIVAARFGRLALVVAYLDAQAYDVAAIERGRGDADWLAREARLHERVVERAAVHAHVVPSPLLTLFATAADLERAAAAEAARWSRQLARFAAQREYAIFGFAGPHVAPGREPYLLRVSARTVRSDRAPNFAGEHAAQLAAVWSTARAASTAIRRVDLAGVPRAVLGAAVLVDDQRVDALRDALSRLAAPGGGLSFYLEGPRAPHSFA